jgi:hypothetical protein
VTRLAALAAAACGLLLAPCAPAATPNELGLAKALKTQMQRTYGTKAPGTKITTVTCKINAAGTGARCAAHFIRSSQNVRGVYQVKVTADANGNTNWKATSASCTHLRTHAEVDC